MSFEPPAGILDIGNATLRVGKLEVAETAGLNQGLQNIVKNDLLITEKETYLANKTWGIKLPTAWVGEFDLKTHDNKYVEFNFYNEGSTSNAFGYTLNFKDTTLTLKYDNGNSNLASETIPDVSTSTYKKVNVFFERGVIAVFIDGARVLYFKESDTYNSVHGHPGMASRVASTTGGSFVNIFIEADGSDSAVKDLRIVNGRLISDKTSNVSFIGSLGVGVHSPKESLDIRGNMHLTRVSNVSQIKVDSNVVAEYTGPHDRPLREYPEIIMTAATTGGYTASASSNLTDKNPWEAFNPSDYWRSLNAYSTSDPYGYTGVEDITDTNGTLHEGEWLKLELPNKINISRVTFAFHSSGSFQPTSYVILGSNNDTSWTLIHTNENLSPGLSPSYLSEDNFTTVGYFKYLKLLVKNVIDATPSVIISRLRYYGHEEGSGSLDTTLKTVYNVPAITGTQLEVYYDAKETSSYPESGVTVTDLSGKGVTGTLTAQGGFENVDNIKAFTSSGSTTHALTATTSLSGSPTMTISTWVKFDSFASTSVIYLLGNLSVNNQMVWLGTQLNGSVWTLANGGAGAYNQYSSNDPPILNSWIHVAAIYSGGTYPEGLSLYINGKLLTPTVRNGSGVSLTLPSNSPLYLGFYSSGTDFFDGSIANFRLYSKVLNADQVKELYDYQKDYFLGSKSQVTLYKGHLGVGVTEPSGQLELAGDERIQEYPPRAMTGYETLMEGHGVFEMYSTGGLYNNGSGGNLPWTVFNKITGTFNDGTSWVSEDAAGAGAGGNYNNGGSSGYGGSHRLSSNTPLGDYLVICLPYSIVLKSYSLSNLAGGTGYGAADFPRDFIIYGSNDDVNWEVVDSRSDQEAGGLAPAAHVSAGYLGYTNNYTVPENNKVYSKFAIVITDINAQSWYNFSNPINASYAAISEWRLFGTPGPTTLDKGSLSLTRSLDVPRVSRYDVDTETPRPEKLVVDYDTTVNSSPTDISGKGNHGTFKGTAQYSPADKAFKFDGASATYIYNGNASGTPTGDAIYSIVGWVNVVPSIANFGQLLTFGSAWGTKTIGALAINTSYGFQASIGGDAVKSPDGVITPNTWHHIAAVKVATGVCTVNTYDLYLDGVLITNKTYAGSNLTQNIGTGTQYLSVGGGFTGSSTDAYNGLISNPKLYSVALEPSEIKKLYNLGRTGRSMVISDTAVGIGKTPEAQLDVRGNLAVRGDIESFGPNMIMSSTGNLSILGSINGASVTAPYVRSHYDRYGFDGNWRTLITTSAQDCGIGHLVNETGHQYAVFWFAHAGNGTGYVGWIQNGGYTNIAYSGSNIKVQGPVGTITRAYVLYLNNG